ncbi:MAG: IPT/TIG domain-containing protein, partial [Acidobacteriota bacterium]
PAVDAGSELAELRALSERTTQTSQQLDAGRLDLGAHYPVVSLTIGATPQLLHLVPAFGDFQGGDWVLARGTAFDPGAQVTFDGTQAAQTLFVGPRRLLAQPPAWPLEGLATPVQVQVLNPGGLVSPQTLTYRFVDAEPPEWDSTVGVLTAESPREPTLAIIVRWNPALDEVSPPVSYNVHRVENVSSSSQLLIPQASNRIASGLTGTSYVDVDFKGNDAGKTFVYRVRAVDSAFQPNEEMNLVRMFGTVVKGNNPSRPDPAIYLFRARESESPNGLVLEALVSNQGTAIAPSITLELTLPPELTFVPSSSSKDSLPVADDPTGTAFPFDSPGYAVLDLPHSTSTRLRFEVRHDGNAGLLSWLGVVSTPDLEVRTDNNQHEKFIITTSTTSDVAMSKSALVGIVSGNDLEYTLDVTVTSTSTATSVILTDTLPEGVRYKAGSLSRDGQPLADDDIGTPFPLDEGGLALGDLQGHASTRIQFEVGVDLPSGSLVNKAAVSSSRPDPDASNNSAQAVTQVLASGVPLQPVGDTLRWGATAGELDWDPAAGAALYFVHRSIDAAAYAAGTAQRLTPLGTLPTAFLDAQIPSSGQAFFYRVNAGDGVAETDELGGL